MKTLSTRDADFSQHFQALVNDRREEDVDVSAAVRAILHDVKNRGDAAVFEYTAKYDGHVLSTDSLTGWRFRKEEFARAFDGLSDELRFALILAADRIEAYHRDQMPQNRDFTDHTGMRLGAIWRPVDAAGLYVPGGRAAYPSSLLMNAIPAKVAGVERIIAVSPTLKGKVNPLVLAAAHLAGIDEIWRIGGAQAIAALAYGTANIAAVDVITGPGNAYVAEAKRQLYGVVGIDMVAGPSEILVIADGHNDPAWIAADLLSQAEHDPNAQAILITDDESFAEDVLNEVEHQGAQLATADVAMASWDAHGTIIIVQDWNEAADLANKLAAEHVEIAMDDPDAVFAKLRHAGSVFLGRHTPEALGDYIAGPNHVLPTGRRARFSSGLSVLDFMKRTSFLSANSSSLAQLGTAAINFAQAEGLPAHAQSIALRLQK